MNMTDGRLKIVILTGQDSASTCLFISKLINLPQVEIVGILLESQPQSFKRRLRNLQRNIRREGVSYMPFRLAEFLKDFLNRLAARIVIQEEVVELLRQSFPERAFCLADIGRLSNIPLLQVGNLNAEAAAKTLQSFNSDLGVVLGTRILKRSTFAIPRMGCINLHMGKVPEYRGMPPAFWELYDGQSTAGITVHSVDDGLDTGDILIEGTVSIHPKDSPETLRKKLEVRSSELLAQCVAELAQGQAVRRPQPPSNYKPYTSPTRRQRLQLDKKLGMEQRHTKADILKTVFCLFIYYAGFFHLVRALRQVARSSRTCILLYHRVNDLADDVLTADLERFVEQMVTLNKYYTVISSSEMVGKLKSTKRLPSNSIVIHFDDCYRDVFTNASPILAQIKFPACCFVSSGYVDTERAFPHDADKCPFGMENLRANDLLGLMEKGFEIGSHTVNHVDLGRCSDEVAINELVQSKRDLERILDKPVTLFSYPFGKKTTIRPQVVELVRKANYEAMFSAHGGYVTGKSDLFNLPRVGVSRRFRPLDLLMEIEGVSFGALKRHWRDPK